MSQAVPLSGYIEQFIIARTYSPAAARQRRTILTVFARFVDDPPPAEVTHGQVLDWWIGTEHQSANTRKAYLFAVRAFMGYLVATNTIERDPTAHIVAPRIHRRPPIVLSDEQLVEVLRHATTIRDQAIVALMAGCGLRSSDVSALRVEDVDLAQRLLSVVGKGNKRRLVPMPTIAVGCVETLMKQIPSTGPLIRKLRGEGGVNPASVRTAADKVLRAAEIRSGPGDGRAPHVLRRTFATNLLESGATIVEVGEILGHADVSSTMPYLARPDAQKLVEVVEASPIAQMQMPPLAP